MALLEQIGNWLRGDRRPPRHILSDLVADYEGELQAAAELRAYAERVPYAQAATTLLRLADESDRAAEELAKEIRGLGGTPPSVSPTVSPLLNHWQRMAACQQTSERRRQRYLEQSIHWDIDYPGQAEVLSRMAGVSAHQRGELEDLIARADTLALD